MNRNYLTSGVIIVVLGLGLGYIGRHHIKSMLGMSNPAPVAIQNSPIAVASTSSNPSASAEASIVMVKTDAQKGAHLTDSKGMALYTFDKDATNKSNCTGICLTVWPPFSAPSSSPSGLPTSLGVITSANGSYQYTYKGMPLYYYAKDKNSSDILGDGVGGVWHIVKQ